MKLWTKTPEKRFAQVGSQSAEKDPLIIAKFFNPAGAGTWYSAEYDPNQRVFFGMSRFSAIGTMSGAAFR